MKQDETIKEQRRPWTYISPVNKSVRCTECGIAVDLCQCVGVDHLIHERLWSPWGRMARGMLKSLNVNQASGNDTHTLTTLMVHVGKISELLTRIETGQENAVSQSIVNEAIEIGATAIRLAVEGDRNFPDYNPTTIFPEN